MSKAAIRAGETGMIGIVGFGSPLLASVNRGFSPVSRREQDDTLG